MQQALAAIEKKKAIQAQIVEWAGQLAEGVCPAPVREQLYRILFKPDKNAPEYKAVVEASRASQRAPLELLERAGAIDSPYQFHWRRFLFENFPKGTGFPALVAPAIADELPLAEGVEAFSIDDSQTTEIDDALSVQGLGSGTVTVGIHIAAPGLALAPGSAIDQVARARMSTVYMPGYKITMLPDEVVDTYTLLEGADRPAVSLYARFDEATLELQSTETKLERVPIAANLRHDQLDSVVTQPWLEDGSITHEDTPAAAALPSPALVPAPPRAPAEGPARGRARQARELQPARLQLPPGRQRRRRTHGRRAGADHDAPARRAARPDRVRGHDPGQQQLGRLARRARRARALPQPGQPRARHQRCAWARARCRTRAWA